jgi:hypothetical protein
VTGGVDLEEPGEFSGVSEDPHALNVKGGEAPLSAMQ